MSNRIRLVLAFVLAALLAGTAPAVLAAPEASDAALTIETDTQSYVVQADGSFELTRDVVIKLNEDRAVKAASQFPLSYNQTLETLEVTQAYNEKPDGKKVVVQADQIKDQQEAASAGAPMFRDTLVKVVIFPDVAVGDRLVLQYKRRRTTPLFPGQFEDLIAPPFADAREASITYDMPAAMALQSDAVGFTASSPPAGDGRRAYRWDYVPTRKARIEAGSVSYFDYGQRLAVSTFADYASFAQAYDRGSADKTAPTPRIRELAAQITAGQADARAKAYALTDWVRRNIRYVAVYIGPGGVIPHAAETVLDNRYGDCKDHVALLEALLAAAGIDSTPALINAGNAYRLPKVATLGLLNHVITYVPSLDLYLDSTATAIAPGYLPIIELGKPVLLTKTGRLSQVPSQQRNEIVGRTTFTVGASGAVDFTMSSAMTGWGAEANRYLFRNIKASDRNALATRMLQALGPKAIGTIDAGDLAGSGDSYEVKLAGHVDGFVDLPGPIGLPALTSLSGGVGPTARGMSAEKDRTQPFVCLASQIDERSEFVFPNGIEIVAIPKSATAQGGGVDYASDYRREGNSVFIERRLRFDHPGAICSPEDFKAMRGAVDTMMRDLRGQIVVQAQP